MAEPALLAEIENAPLSRGYSTESARPRRRPALCNQRPLIHLFHRRHGLFLSHHDQVHAAVAVVLLFLVVAESLC